VLQLHDTIILTFGLLIAIVLLASIAIRLHIPYAILLVIGGVIMGFIPALPNVTLEPDLVLLLFLPPLIFSSAWRTSWRNFRCELRSILLLAIGLVLATMVVVAMAAHTLIPGLSWPTAFVLGAVVSPTDVVAAESIMQRLGLMRRVATIIGGESLVNDATALVVYRFAVAAVISGTFSLWQAGLQFVLVSVGGIAVGLLIAWPVSRIHYYIEDAPSEITITLLASYAAYLLAESLDLSGVLATVAAGLYLSRQSATFFSSSTRLQAYSFWNVLVFLFNGFIFLLIGLELYTIVQSIPNTSLLTLIGYAAIVSLVVIVVRIAWASATNSILGFLYRRSLTRYQPPGPRATQVIGWAGMRGGVSLATALAIPLTIASGAPFPDRDLVIFLTFGVILSTLVLQGLTLGPLISRLGLAPDPGVARETREALHEATIAALARLDELTEQGQIPENYAHHLHAYYERKLDIIDQHTEAEDREALRKGLRDHKRLHHELRQVERARLIALRNKGEIDDEIFHRIERELDLEEQRLVEL
jgi:Na+/H+ antiporter